MKLPAGPIFRFACSVTAVSSALALASAADAAEHAVFLNAPLADGSPAPKLAAQFQLKLHLPEGRGLARMLLDAGVNRDDAASAARLAAGHLGAGLGGCNATVSIERSTDAKGFSLMRVQLTTAGAQTVIERRGHELTVASDTPTGNSASLV